MSDFDVLTYKLGLPSACQGIVTNCSVVMVLKMTPKPRFFSRDVKFVYFLNSTFVCKNSN